MKLNLKQIEVFRAIMLTGSVSGAANLLHVSQPAISRLISYVEQKLGVALFERIKGRLHPTPEAHHLFSEITMVYDGIQRINETVEDIIENRIGHLRIVCSPSLGQNFIPKAISLFNQELPEAKVILYTMVPEHLLKSLSIQQAEVGVAFFHEQHPNLHFKTLFENRLLVALPSGHPLAAQECLSLKDIVEYPMISYSSTVPLGHVIRRFYAAHQVSVFPKIEVQQIHVACALVREGLGIAIVDEVTANGSNWPNIVFRKLENATELPISIVYNKYEPLSRLAQKFIDNLFLVKNELTK